MEEGQIDVVDLAVKLLAVSVASVHCLSILMELANAPIIKEFISMWTLMII